jgi:hypothetical protein
MGYQIWSADLPRFIETRTYTANVILAVSIIACSQGTQLCGHKFDHGELVRICHSDRTPLCTRVLEIISVTRTLCRNGIAGSDRRKPALGWRVSPQLKHGSTLVMLKAAIIVFWKR